MEVRVPLTAMCLASSPARNGDRPTDMIYSARMYGGHGQINRAVFGGSDSTLGFAVFVNDDSIFIGWRSRSVNLASYGQIQAPVAVAANIWFR
jgi:hypothetical protein